MRIIDYRSSSNINEDDYILIDGKTKGTRKIQAAAISGNGTLINDDPIHHRSKYRGDYLGETATQEQIEAIRDGSFEDLYIGDYWGNDDVKYTIADIDYFYSPIFAQNPNVAGYYDCLKDHHLLVIFEMFYFSKYNTSDLRQGYAGSYAKSVLNNYVTILESVFSQGNILEHSEYMSTGVDNSNPPKITNIRIPSQLDLLTETMIFGQNRSSNVNANSVPTNANQQLAIFNLNPSEIYNFSERRGCDPLRDVVSRDSYRCINERRIEDKEYSKTIGDIRPYFLLG